MTDMSVLREAVAVASQQAISARTIVFRPGTVADVSADQTLVTVQVDDDPNTGEGGGDDAADTGVIGAQMLFPSARPGDRVLVMFVPPHGAYVIGRYGGDYEDPHYVGAEDEVPFAASWDNASDTGLEGTDNYARVRFQRLGRLVELRGRATRNLDATGPSTIFTLPEEYRPGQKMSFPAPNGPLGAIQAIIIITLAGAVQVLKFGGTIGGGAGNFVSLDGIQFAAALTDPSGL